MIDEKGRHIPANPEKFTFDADVAKIFPDMARRSIPNFEHAHHAHARMLGPWLQTGASVLDVGASRGAFFQALIDVYGMDIFNSLSITAIDSSSPMCDLLHDDFPTIRVINGDITDQPFRDTRLTYDIVVCNYTLQFVQPSLQAIVLESIINKVKPGGVLVFGHKASHEGQLGELAHDEYINFRVANGYDEEEIRAKTKALKGSMFPMSHEYLLRHLRTDFDEIQETTRLMMFSTLIARKRRTNRYGYITT